MNQTTQAPTENALTKQRSLGGTPMKGSPYLRAFFLFLILVALLLATAVISFEMGRWYQNNEVQEVAVTRDDTDSNSGDVNNDTRPADGEELPSSYTTDEGEMDAEDLSAL